MLHLCVTLTLIRLSEYTSSLTFNTGSGPLGATGEQLLQTRRDRRTCAETGNGGTPDRRVVVSNMLMEGSRCVCVCVSSRALSRVLMGECVRGRPGPERPAAYLADELEKLLVLLEGLQGREGRDRWTAETGGQRRQVVAAADMWKIRGQL